MGIISRRLVTLDELARTSYVKEIIIKKYEPADLAFRNLVVWKKGLMFRNVLVVLSWHSFVLKINFSLVSLLSHESHSL